MSATTRIATRSFVLVDGHGTQPLFIVLQLVGWSGYIAALMAPWLGTFSVASMLAPKLIIAGFGLLTTLLLRALYLRMARLSLGIARWGGVVVIASFAGAVIWTSAAGLLVSPSHYFYTDVDASAVLAPPQLSGVIYHAMVLISWSMLYFGIKHERALAQERLRVSRAEAMATDARLEALRYQIRPHFIFNTLNAVSSLILLGKQDEARNTVNRLGDFLRHTLENEESEVTIEAEVDSASRYMAIERVRFGSRLQVRFDVAPAARSARVPALILQPLLENAVKYAIDVGPNDVQIAVTARVERGRLSIEVRDNGPGFGPAVRYGIGLRNTQRRLADLYGDAARLVVDEARPSGALVRIEIPA